MNDLNSNPATGADVDPDTEERDDAIIGVALKWSLLVFLVLLLAGGAFAWYVTRPIEEQHAEEAPLAKVARRAAPEVELPRVPFTDVTSEAGIEFVHENGAAGEKLLPETMGGGCAFLDYDDDGDQDLLLVNSDRWSWSDTADDQPATMALYENDGTGHFSDVTADSGLDVSFYAMGAAVGDYDNDGLIDIFLSAVGPDRLFHNEGKGKFKDVTAASGVAGDEQEWGTSCGWFDYDRDGDLDLFVCNYLKWSREYDIAQNFQLTGGGRAYGRPQNFQGTFPYLYRNDGDGTFADVTAEAGLHVRNPATDVPMAKSLGVCFADFDRDGWLDIIVANDTIQNFLFHNQRNGTFHETGATAGVAFDMDGNARGAMGIDVAPFRNSAAMGIAIGNFSNEMTALYVAENNQLVFMDQAISTGLGPNTRLQLTFGLFYFDFDLDGRLDLFAANGHLEDEINRVQPSQTYEQAPQLFWNCGPASATEFMPMSAAQTGEDFVRPLVGRGASFADIDSDGDLDVLLMAVGRPPRLLRNDQQLGHHWLRVSLEGVSCPKDAIGSWVSLDLGDRTLRRQVMPTRSYLSQTELPITFGLEDTDQIESITVHWSDGSEQTVEVDGVDQVVTVKQTKSPDAAGG